MSMLFDCHPLVVDKELATILGLNEALVLQQVHYWIEMNKKQIILIRSKWIELFGTLLIMKQ